MGYKYGYLDVQVGEAKVRQKNMMESPVGPGPENVLEKANRICKRQTSSLVRDGAPHKHGTVVQ